MFCSEEERSQHGDRCLLPLTAAAGGSRDWSPPPAHGWSLGVEWVCADVASSSYKYIESLILSSHFLFFLVAPYVVDCNGALSQVSVPGEDASSDNIRTRNLCATCLLTRGSSIVRFLSYLLSDFFFIDFPFLALVSQILF
ncbi:hypothetical protein METBIDRAFT_96054 [Metschnikowia bicuspidata var. bicuspidata NRRL YB-4993]|uniref:Uncharacterized protein n=1 Tax=Metschnikowia bicuspidata var. bicuspidata NRRL YB-4993 TaxID=869754 RepID=A0A1A0HGK9_9ASCO|nr:hypothetical protein METBIDRAFT_96054 [Metschnikowia bicuspidata var. bicuspidata NRRL YB-4993]OBA22988.1 hypothetical protein METBIDRAFT_96054 [Metschnikowia bicuspidata var. bicuspidata NRRL YB-4993]